MNDILLFAILNAYVVFLLILTELLTAKEKMSDATARKTLHILVGNVVLFLPYFESWWIVVVIPAVYVVVNFLMSPHSPLEKLRLKTFEAGHSLGTVYYAASLLGLVILLWNDPFGIILCFLPLAYGDGMAAVIGTRKPIRRYQTIGGSKSVGGTVAFVVFSAIALILSLGFSYSFSFNLVGIILAISVIAALIELVSPKGMDNLFIPIILGILYLGLNLKSQIEP